MEYSLGLARKKVTAVCGTQSMSDEVRVCSSQAMMMHAAVHVAQWSGKDCLKINGKSTLDMGTKPLCHAMTFWFAASI